VEFFLWLTTGHPALDDEAIAAAVTAEEAR
jgi:hypothetical protein